MNRECILCTSEVPDNANNADIHVLAEMVLPSSKQARNGTIFTFKYRRNALLDAVVDSNPMD